MAFLSIFPNTQGFTVVIPKEHQGSYAFSQSDEVITNLVLATKKVALVLDAFFDNVERCGMFFEGYGVDHLHSKLFPMHGTAKADVTESPEIPRPNIVYKTYPGYLSSHDAGRADDNQLATLAQQIRESTAVIGKA